ncbi:MAG: FtsX-like permease family protein, partial [Bacteroidota bacterium]
MNLPYFIARRYLFSKKSSNAINIITWVSILGIGVGTAALILVLSVFNGLTGFIEGLFSAMDPGVKVVAARGQTFAHDDSIMNYLELDPEVAAVAQSIEGRVWLEHLDFQTYAVLKGVSEDFLQVNRLDTFVYDGNFDLAPRNGVARAIMGTIIAAELNTQVDGEFHQPLPVSVSYIPQSASFRMMARSVNMDYLVPSGFFNVQKSYDEKYVVCDLDFAQELFEEEGRISSYELKLKDIDQAGEVKSRLQAAIGDQYEVLTWYEQHKTLYQVMRNEKYISYLILVLMLAISAVNIVGSLSMIVLEKTKDIAVLKSMGATADVIRRVFLTDGLLVGLIGGLLGVVLALVLGFAQIRFGLVKIQGGGRVEAFPVEMEMFDFVLVFFTV